MLESCLAEHPEDLHVLCSLAEACLELRDLEAAHEWAQKAIATAPNQALCWRLLGSVLWRRHRLREAVDATRRSIEIAPRDHQGFALLSAIHLAEKNWRAALDAAEQGLAIEGNDTDCLNLRASALTHLGRHRDAAESLQGALRQSPENAWTHANQGWNLLHQGKYHESLDHFRESLRLEPDLEWAQEGIKNALRARHWMYRPALRYFLWMSRLKGRAQAGVILGGYVLYRIAFSLRDQAGPLAPLLYLVIGLYVLLVISSWFATPIANLLLCASRFGRLALSRREKLGAVLISSLFLGGIGLVVLGSNGPGHWMLAGVALALLALPVHLAFEVPETKVGPGLWIYTGLVALLGAYWVFLAFQVEIDGRALAALTAELPEQASNGAELERLLTSEPEHLERLERLLRNQERVGQITLWFALLAWLGSQILASFLARRALGRA